MGLTSMQGAFLCPFCFLQGQRKAREASCRHLWVAAAREASVQGPLEKGVLSQTDDPSRGPARVPQTPEGPLPPVTRVVSPGTGTAG